MPQSQSELPTVHEAILSTMEAIGAVGKTGYNKHQGFKFRSIDDVVAAVQPALIANGLTIVPEVIHQQAFTQERGPDKSVLHYVTVQVKFTLTGPDGSQISAIMCGEAADSGDKAASKATTMAVKYFLFNTFWIPVAQDDPDGQSYEPARQASQPAQRPQATSGGGLQERVANAAQRPQGASQQASGGPLATDPQVRLVKRLVNNLGWDSGRLTQEIEIATGEPTSRIEDLTKRGASRLIDFLQERLEEPGPDAGSGYGTTEEPF